MRNSSNGWKQSRQYSCQSGEHCGIPQRANRCDRNRSSMSRIVSPITSSPSAMRSSRSQICTLTRFSAGRFALNSHTNPKSGFEQSCKYMSRSPNRLLPASTITYGSEGDASGLNPSTFTPRSAERSCRARGTYTRTVTFIDCREILFECSEMRRWSSTNTLRELPSPPSLPSLRLLPSAAALPKKIDMMLRVCANPTPTSGSPSSFSGTIFAFRRSDPTLFSVPSASLPKYSGSDRISGSSPLPCVSSSSWYRSRMCATSERSITSGSSSVPGIGELLNLAHQFGLLPRRGCANGSPQCGKSIGTALYASPRSPGRCEFLISIDSGIDPHPIVLTCPNAMSTSRKVIGGWKSIERRSNPGSDRCDRTYWKCVKFTFISGVLSESNLTRCVSDPIVTSSCGLVIPDRSGCPVIRNPTGRRNAE
eukprot:comp22450_c0_seq1/m.55202 comp22450_c0_seq1/g.55202  ORF comp22450_c0_seq1/g.55202 comp22450_c0_seq1/m.55202 type:complete len:423 (-) comp22450_c0_seq1:1974-3242(-)